MSSAVRSVRSLKKPDQNSSPKYTWLWVYQPVEAPVEFLKFSCQDGVFELTGTDAESTPAEVIDAASQPGSDVRSDYFRTRYSGGLRAAYKLGPNFVSMLKAFLNTDPSATISVVSPGQASRVQVVDNGNKVGFLNSNLYTSVIDGTSVLDQYGGYEAYFPVDIDLYGYVDPARSTWVMKEPMRIRVSNDGETAPYEYFFFQPVGDDVLPFLPPPNPNLFGLDPNATPGRSVDAAVAKVPLIAKGLIPANKAAAEKLRGVVAKKVEGIKAKAAAAAQVAAAAQPSA